MQRRDFFKWLAAATGAVYIEPGLALASRTDEPVLLGDIDLWIRFSRSGLAVASFDVPPGQDVVIHIEALDGFVVYVTGMKALVGPALIELVEVKFPALVDLVGEHLQPEDVDLLCPGQSIDLHYFNTTDCYCPFDGGVVMDDRRTRVRLRTFEHVVEPVTVGLMIHGSVYESQQLNWIASMSSMSIMEVHT